MDPGADESTMSPRPPLAHDLNSINNGDFLELTEKFTTDRIFDSRKDLIDWAKYKAKECDSVIVISKSDSVTRHRLYLSCAQNSKREETVKKVNKKQAMRTCPFQLRGVYLCEGKWKLKVHCGRHDHLLGNTSEGHLCAGHLKPNEGNLGTPLTNSVMKAEHIPKARYANNPSPTSPVLLKESVKTMSQQVRCRKKTSQFDQSRKRNPSALGHTQPVLTKKVKHMNTRSSLRDISIDYFWEVTRPFIDNVLNVASDGHCGFRAVAAGLEKDSLCGWLAVRKELIVELESFKEEYMRIYRGEEHFKRILDVLGCTSDPCPPEGWFTLPAMGHLVASRYGVVFVCISHLNAQTFVPHRLAPASNELKVIAIGHIDRVHFVSVKLKPDCPVPKPVKLGVNDEVAVKWEDLLKNRSDAFDTISGHQLSKQADAKFDLINIE